MSAVNITQFSYKHFSLNACFYKITEQMITFLFCVRRHFHIFHKQPFLNVISPRQIQPAQSERSI